MRVRRIQRPSFIVILAAIPLLTGCVSDSAPSTDAPNLTASDFASTEPTPASPAPISQPRSVISAPAARNGATDVVVLTGAPSLPLQVDAQASAPAPALGTERKLLVDQLVGQINGRPVYADGFFAPMDERFRREAGRMKSRDWLIFARKEIEAALWDTLRDELLLAEFETGLTSEQRLGLLAFIDDVRSNVVSGNLGSPELARQRLLDTEGLDLESKVEDVTQREFIAFQLKKAIGNRVNVAARDIEQYYAQHPGEFAPPPIARFVIIRLPSADPSKIIDCESALAAGESFEAVAARLSTWRPDAGNASEAEIKDGDYAAAALFGPKPLNDAARALTPGHVSPRIDFSGDTYWIKLSALNQEPARSLYEVQREIEEKIRTQRVREEETRYFEQLFRRGSFSDVKEMTNRLFEFAAERYLIQGQAKKE